MAKSDPITILGDFHDFENPIIRFRTPKIILHHLSFEPRCTPEISPIVMYCFFALCKAKLDFLEFEDIMNYYHYYRDHYRFGDDNRYYASDLRREVQQKLLFSSLAG